MTYSELLKSNVFDAHSKCDPFWGGQQTRRVALSLTHRANLLERSAESQWRSSSKRCDAGQGLAWSDPSEKLCRSERVERYRFLEEIRYTRVICFIMTVLSALAIAFGVYYAVVSLIIFAGIFSVNMRDLD